MRRTAIALIVLALPLGLTACEQATEVVDEATEQAQETVQLVNFCRAALDVANAVETRDWDGAVRAGQTMVDHAPDEIRPEAETVLDGARRIRDGETQVAQDPSFQQAAEELEAFARDRCDPAS